MSRLSALLAVLCAACFLIAAPARAADQNTFTFAVIPDTQMEVNQGLSEAFRHAAVEVVERRAEAVVEVVTRAVSRSFLA